MPSRLHPVVVAVPLAALAMLCGQDASAQGTPAGASSSSASPTPNDPSGARAKYDAGTSAFAEGRFAEAALDFEAAASQQPNAVAVYTAALSWEKAGVPDRAADDYARGLAMGGLPPDEADRATQRLGSLEATLGAVQVTSRAEEARVQLDAHSEVPTPAKLHAAAGVHTLTVRRAGQPIEHLSLVLVRGTVTPLDLSAARSESAPASEPASTDASASNPAPSGEPAPATPLRSAIGFAILGAGATALLAGSLLAVEAFDARDAYDAAPTTQGYDHANGLQTWTNAAFVSGGVLAAAGLVLVLWPNATPSSRSSTSKQSGRNHRLRLGFAGREVRVAVDL